MRFERFLKWATILVAIGWAGVAMADPTPPPMLEVKQITDLTLDTVRESSELAVQFRAETAAGVLLLGRVYDNANEFEDGSELSADAYHVKLRVLENDSMPSIGAGDRLVVNYIDAAGNPQVVYVHFPATTAPDTWYIGATGQLFDDYPATTGAGEAPSPAPSPTPSASPSPTATPSPEPTSSPSPSPEPTKTPEPSPSPTATPTPSPSPIPSPSVTPAYLLVSGAGTSAVNGVYSYAGTNGGCFYLAKHGDSLRTIRYESIEDIWVVTSLSVAQYYITAAVSQCDTDLTGTWTSTGVGSAPVPAVEIVAYLITPTPTANPTATPSPAPSAAPSPSPSATPSPAPVFPKWGCGLMIFN